MNKSRIKQYQKEHVGKLPIVVIENGLSREECDSLIAMFNKDEAVDSFLPGKEGKKCTNIAIWKNDCVQWLYDRMFGLVKEANERNFKFDPNLNGDIEDMFINRYNAESMDHRGWHIDGTFTNNEQYATRKLSAVVQLSDSHEYEGGDIELHAYHNPKKTDLRQKGTVLIFPSFEWHRVTDMLKGDRYSLIYFVHGVPFK